MLSDGALYYYLQNEALNANDYFFNRDSIDKPKARRNEGGFTIGGPVVKDKIFFFGGYQYTKADTGFVPTASSRTVLPEALSLISGPRTAANIAAAFRQLNGNFPLTEARYQGTKGTKLLQATAFNQGYDLNDPSTPDYIFERFNQAYVSAGSPNGPLNDGATARARGVGRAFGFRNSATGQPVDFNLSNAAGALIGFEARGPILGFNVPEALLLQSSANSIYHAAQFGVTKRFSRGLQFNAFYTYSKSVGRSIFKKY